MGIEDLTYQIRGAVFEVNRILGAGFLEKVYERALVLELMGSGLKAASQVPINVKYKDQNVGEYFADIIVNDCLLIELKASKSLTDEHKSQVLHYLKATGIEHALLINFGSYKFKIQKFIQTQKVTESAQLNLSL